jgi:GYF domain 2
MRMFISITLLLFFSFLSAYIAKRRGRDPVAWFMIGVLLGIFAPILLMILKPLDSKARDVEKNEDVQLGQMIEEDAPSPNLSKDWFYMDSAYLQQGPVNFLALKTLWEDKNINPATYVWAEGMADWKRVAEVSGLQDDFTKKG